MNGVKFILAFAMFGLSFYYAYPLIKRYIPQEQTQTKEGVQWKKFSPELVEKAKAEGKPVIIDFYADWCAACVEMEHFVFSKDFIIEKSRDFAMLKVDATTPFDELPEWQKAYSVYGLPTMIFINSKGKVLKDLTLTGFEEAPLFKVRMEKTQQ